MSRRFVRKATRTAVIRGASASDRSRCASFAHARHSRWLGPRPLAMTPVNDESLSFETKESTHGFHPQRHPHRRHPLTTSGTRCAISARCIRGWCRASCTDTKLDGDARIVTFANGTVARELLVDCDEARRRLVYAVDNERVKQHSASVQVFADGDARSRLIWIVDVLPNEIAPYIDAQMDQAALRDAERPGPERRMMSSAFLDALGADGPAADRAGKMDLYGRFVGSWDLRTAPAAPPAPGALRSPARQDHAQAGQHAEHHHRACRQREEVLRGRVVRRQPPAAGGDEHQPRGLRQHRTEHLGRALRREIHRRSPGR